MEWYWSGLILIGTICALLALAVPVAFAFFAGSILGALMVIGGDNGMRQLAANATISVTSFALVPIPLFLLMGELFFHTGVATLVFDAFDKLLGRVRGRLSYVTVAGGAVFAALSGSSMANTALLGSSLVPEMIKRGYKPKMSLGPILGTGGLAIIIPPSALAVLLGSLAKVDIGKILIGGVLPGLTLALLYVATIAFQLRMDPGAAPAYDVKRASAGEKFRAVLFGLLPMLFVVFMVIGLMLLGVATPSEAAAFGVLGVLTIAIVYRRLTAGALFRSMVGTLRTTAMVFLIIVGSSTFSQVLALSGATSGLVAWSSNLHLSPYVMLATMIAILLFLGCIMEQVSILMLTVPLFYPLAQALGFDLVWFSIIVLLMLEVGLITPPLGLGLFVLQGVVPKGTPFATIVRAGLPYIGCTMLLVLLIIFFPAIATWLPSHLD
ncbi:MAG: TRAP transporter large permease subunit [Rhodospirillaceae bacterium]|nr:TRAP transporter large permease subunit [Rhodospirillaceae bacterium]